MLETRNNSVAALAQDMADCDLVITRVFDAPREMVWGAWADPEQVAQWWGPHGFTTTIQKFEFRAGGVWQQVMRSAGGSKYPCQCAFTEIVEPSLISYAYNDKELSPLGTTFHATITMVEEGKKTRLTMRITFPTPEDRDICAREYRADEGGQQILENLANHLAKSIETSARAPEYVLHISRMLDAPRELVYKAFTDPGMLAEWMGPVGFNAKEVEQDFRVGGKWRLCLERNELDPACDSQGLMKLWQHGTYLEIVPPERLVYTFAWENRVGIPDIENTITVTFRELEGKTVMDFKQGPFESVEERDGHNVGWSSAFDRFAEFLRTPVGKEVTYDLVIERVFDAPRELVWKVWTDPQMAREWAGPRGFTATHYEQDARVGGKWRLCLHSDGFDVGDGHKRVMDLWQGGVFQEIIAPERVVYTFAWESDIGYPTGEETLVTVTFEERGSKTAMRFQQQFFREAKNRDGHVKGWNSAFDKFGEMLGSAVIQ